MNKALIISFPRSGTHFLMNTLAENFGYVNKHTNLETYGFNFYVPRNVHWILFQINAERKEPTFVKSHHEIEFFGNMLPDILDMYDVFYIYRNMPDVMRSYCKHLNALPWTEGPNAENGNDLERLEPVGGMLRYQTRQYKTMRDKYLAHVSGWKSTALNHRIVYVRYEDLNKNFNETVKKIAGKINKRLFTITRPDKNTGVVKDGELVVYK